MRKAVFVSLLAILSVASIVTITLYMSARAKKTSTLTLTSSAFEHGGAIPAKYTCDGKNISPPLTISGVPEGTRSLALIMDDPDAPVGVWDHWIVFDMPPTTEHIAEGEEPMGVHGKGSGDNLTYKGPCPPSGTHHYYFKLYALNFMLALPEGVTKNEVLRKIDSHILAQTELIGTYTRK